LKVLAILAILVLFGPIATFGQQWTDIIIEPKMVLSNENSNVVIISVTVDGFIQDDGNLQLIIEGLFDSNDLQKYEETFEVSWEEPTHVFELNYPFTPNEAYQLTAINGEVSKSIEWIPSIPTQKESETEISVERITTEKLSKSNEEGVTNTLIEQEATTETDTSEASTKVQSLTEKKGMLKQTLENKNAVIEEQKKVIKILSKLIKNVNFDESSGKLFFMSETSEDSKIIKSLIKSNKYLEEKIKKTDVIIMKQVLKIRDLASQIRNAVFDPPTNYFSKI